MNLVIDIGNTKIKCALMQNGEIVELHEFLSKNYAHFIARIKLLNAKHCILSTTKQDNNELLLGLEKQMNTINFTAKTPIPINITYSTPGTLGDDRKAAVVGAVKESPHTPLLVITAGTCITYNYFNGESFVGGGISPGIHMRYKSMHDYTGKLPYAPHNEFFELVGKTTIESLQSGVQQGILAEVDGIIDKYWLLHDNLKVFVCGGDTNFFDSRLKNKIFANPNLILYGLNEILEYNKHS